MPRHQESRWCWLSTQVSLCLASGKVISRITTSCPHWSWIATKRYTHCQVSLLQSSSWLSGSPGMHSQSSWNQVLATFVSASHSYQATKQKKVNRLMLLILLTQVSSRFNSTFCSGFCFNRVTAHCYRSTRLRSEFALIAIWLTFLYRIPMLFMILRVSSSVIPILAWTALWAEAMESSWGAPSI